MLPVQTRGVVPQLQLHPHELQDLFQQDLPKKRKDILPLYRAQPEVCPDIRSAEPVLPILC